VKKILKGINPVTLKEEFADQKTAKNIFVYGLFIF